MEPQALVAPLFAFPWSFVTAPLPRISLPFVFPLCFFSLDQI